MTRLHPEERPSKEQVARDLATWQSLVTEPVTFDVSEARSRLRAKLGSAMSAQDILEQQKESAYAAVVRLQSLTGPLNEGLKELYPRTEIDSATDKMTHNIVRSHGGFGQQPVVFRWHRCTLVAPFDRLAAPTLRMSRSLELLSDGRLEMYLMVHVGPEGVMGTYHTWQSQGVPAPVGSVEAEKMLEDGVGELSEALKRAVDIFVEHLPAMDAGG